MSGRVFLTKLYAEMMMVRLRFDNIPLCGKPRLGVLPLRRGYELFLVDFIRRSYRGSFDTRYSII